MSLTLGYALHIRTLKVVLFHTLIVHTQDSGTVDARLATVISIALKIRMATAHTVQEPSVGRSMVLQRILPSME